MYAIFYGSIVYNGVISFNHIFLTAHRGTKFLMARIKSKDNGDIARGKWHMCLYI